MITQLVVSSKSDRAMQLDFNVNQLDAVVLVIHSDHLLPMVSTKTEVKGCIQCQHCENSWVIPNKLNFTMNVHVPKLINKQLLHNSKKPARAKI